MALDKREYLGLPFVTRNMLAFEEGTAFGLRLTVQTSSSSSITVRGMTREGVFTFKQAVAAGATAQTFNFRIPDVPIMVSVNSELATALYGDTYAIIGLTANGDLLNTLAAGFVYSGRGISWPNQNVEAPMPGRGNITRINTTNPGAGAEIGIVVPNGEIWRILSMSFTLVAAASAASRRVHIRVDDPTGSNGIDCFGLVDQIISETKDYCASVLGVIPDETDNNKILIPLPADLYADAGTTISTATTNLQVGDNFSAATLWIERMFSNAS